ncbi:MAG: hypothetical protein ACR2IL_08680 [Chitinophagaceae bacterium]
MSLLRLKAYWEDDDATFRVLEILSTQSYYELHEGLKKALQLPADMEASLFICDARGMKGREVSSTVEKNLRDAPALSMKKTPIAALINDPHQLFRYECAHPKAWVFIIELVLMLPDPTKPAQYPIFLQSEGMSPSQFGILPGDENKEKIIDILEMFDIGADDEEGDDLFGDEEGEEGDESQEESASDDDLV